MVIPSFSSAISLAHLHAVFTRLAHCRGLIIDMRSNGGGLLSNADRLASVLIPSDTVVGYMSTKTGPGHQDFGPLKEIKLVRAPISWQRPTVILVDRGTYSAANSLVAYVKGQPTTSSSWGIVQVAVAACLAAANCPTAGGYATPPLVCTTLSGRASRGASSHTSSRSRQTRRRRSNKMR